MLKNFQIGPFWADWQTPEYVPNSHLYSKYLWKIAGHKYRRGAWNLPHKFHLYLIENGHKKNSPTRIGSGSGVTLSLCDSVTLSLCNSVTL